jgi:ABC-2 type transport system permease protein
MNPYSSLLSARLRMLMQYRAAALAGFCTQLFFGFVRIMVYDGFYRSTAVPQPMNYDQVITYVWLGQATLLLMMFNVDGEIQTMIRTGTVTFEMARPVDLYGFWFFRILASRIAPLLLRGIPIILLAGLFLGLRGPVSWLAGFLWLLATVGAIFLCTAIITLISLTLFWTISGEGISRIVPPLVYMCSGLIIPLPLFPNWLQPVLNSLPFRGLGDVPFRIYTGNLSVQEGLWGIGGQAIWITVLILLGRCILARGVRKLIVQGG